MTRMLFKFAVITSLIFSAGCGSPPKGKLYHFQGRTMGTFYHIKYVSHQNQLTAIKSDVEKSLKAFDLEISNWNPKSWVEEFNKYPKNKQSKVPHNTQIILKQCIDLFSKSHGAFDITVTPLLELWGFGKNKNKTFPDPKLIKAALDRIGSQHLNYSDKNKTLSKSIDNVEINCSALAKGFGVDLIARLLEQKHQIRHFMIEIGGEVRCKGHHPDKKSWVLGIQEPTLKQGRRNLIKAIRLSNESLATSGDYQNYFFHQGNVYPHIFDPKTGMPVKHNLCSVSVISPSCSLSDGLATACLVLGTEKGMQLIKSYKNTEALFVERLADGKYKEHRTPGFSSREVSLD